MLIIPTCMSTKLVLLIDTVIFIGTPIYITVVSVMSDKTHLLIGEYVTRYVLF